MTLRAATFEDEEFFFYWRERSEKTNPAYQGRPTTREEHRAWYHDRMHRLPLFVWETNGVPAGAIRMELNGEISFDCNPLLAPKLLEALKPSAGQFGGRLKCTVDCADKAKAHALKEAGWREFPVKFFVYRH